MWMYKIFEQSSQTSTIRISRGRLFIMRNKLRKGNIPSWLYRSSIISRKLLKEAGWDVFLRQCGLVSFELRLRRCLFLLSITSAGLDLVL